MSYKQLSQSSCYAWYRGLAKEVSLGWDLSIRVGTLEDMIIDKRVGLSLRNCLPGIGGLIHTEENDNLRLRAIIVYLSM